MTKVRVLRLLEYVYGSAEKAEEDMGMWHIPANGTFSRPTPVDDHDLHNVSIKSAVITDMAWSDEHTAQAQMDDFNETLEGAGVPSGLGGLQELIRQRSECSRRLHQERAERKELSANCDALRDNVIELTSELGKMTRQRDNLIEAREEDK
jgi:hypothetical protein